jgi:RNA-binding protein YhbY
MEEILKVIKALGLNESVLNSIRKKLNWKQVVKWS